MYSINSIGSYELAGRGTVYMVASPVTAKRTAASMSETLRDSPHGGDVLIEINGVVYKPIAFEMRMPGTPVAVGELIGILVAPISL